MPRVTNSAVWKRIWNDYSPVIIFVPAMIGLHLAWYKLQTNKILVPEEEQNLTWPHVRAYRHAKNFILEKTSGKGSTNEEPKSS